MLAISPLYTDLLHLTLATQKQLKGKKKETTNKLELAVDGTWTTLLRGQNT